MNQSRDWHIAGFPTYYYIGNLVSKCCIGKRCSHVQFRKRYIAVSCSTTKIADSLQTGVGSHLCYENAFSFCINVGTTVRVYPPWSASHYSTFSLTNKKAFPDLDSFLITDIELSTSCAMRREVPASRFYGSPGQTSSAILRTNCSFLRISS